MRKFEIQNSDEFFSPTGFYNTVPGMKYVCDTAVEICKDCLRNGGYYVSPEEKDGCKQAILIDDEDLEVEEPILG